MKVFGSPTKKEEPPLGCFTLLGTKGRISQFTSRRLISRLPRLTFCVGDVESRALGGGTRMLQSKGSGGPQLEFCSLASSLSGAGLMPRPTHINMPEKSVYSREAFTRTSLFSQLCHVLAVRLGKVIYPL